MSKEKVIVNLSSSKWKNDSSKDSAKGKKWYNTD